MTPKEFNPSITHPAYLIRTNLFKAINAQAKQFQGKLLDIGCGIKPYRDLFEVDEYIGLDFHGEGETYTKEKVDIFYDGKYIPFPDNYFDGVFSSEVFEHVFNPNELIPEIYRVLKPDGLALITCPFSFPEHEIPNDYCRYTSFGIQHLFKENGFSVIFFQKTGNAILARAQLTSIYWNNYLLNSVRSIPILRTISRKSFFLVHHAIALFKSGVLPKSSELYLSNIVVFKKSK